MGLLGILSLLQAWFLPGLMVLLPMRSLPWQDRALLVVPLSLVLNYIAVVVLVGVGSYTRDALLLLIGVEILVIACWVRLIAPAVSSAQTGPASPRIIHLPLRPLNVAVAATLIWSVALAAGQVGTGFVDGDAVQSWNRWAEDWYRGRLPQQTAYYPQALPAAYSLTYVLIGTEQVQFFAKLVPALYPLIATLVWLRMATLLPAYADVMKFAAVLFPFIVARMMGSTFSVNGYTDFPLACFALGVLHLLVVLSGRMASMPAPGRDPLLGVAALLIGGAALVKQPGLYLVAAFPVAWWILQRRSSGYRTNDDTGLARAAVWAIVALFLSGHWYVFKHLHIAAGGDVSNLGVLVGLVDLPWHERLLRGVAMVSAKLTWLWLPLFALGLAQTAGRKLAFWLFLPFFVLWSLGASYDYRNLSLVLPALAAILALAMVRLRTLAAADNRAARVLRGVFKGAVALGVVAVAVRLADENIGVDLRRRADEARIHIGIPAINARLAAWFEYNPQPGRVLSTYFGLGYLPAMADRQVLSGCETFTAWKDHPGIRYLLVSPWCGPSVLESLHAERAGGRLERIFEQDGHVFFRIRDPLPP